ncbi:MAG: hypothetical protein M1839_009369 [Geoglossum umbratile]|nr:MAG: hypothetical protein M1839_009369 [Geoglossum umbratile]
MIKIGEWTGTYSSRIASPIAETFVSVGMLGDQAQVSRGIRDSTRSILRRRNDLISKLRQLDSVNLHGTGGPNKGCTTKGDIGQYYCFIGCSHILKLQLGDLENWEQTRHEICYDRERLKACVQHLVSIKKEREGTSRWSSFAGPLSYSQEQLAADRSSCSAFASPSSPSPGKRFYGGNSAGEQLHGSNSNETLQRNSTKDRGGLLQQTLLIPEFYDSLPNRDRKHCFENIVTVSHISGDKYWACTCLEFLNTCPGRANLGVWLLEKVQEICQALSREETFEDDLVLDSFKFSVKATRDLLILEPQPAEDSNTPLRHNPWTSLIDCVRWLICALLPHDESEGIFRTNMVPDRNSVFGGGKQADNYQIVFEPSSSDRGVTYCWKRMFSYLYIIDLSFAADVGSHFTANLEERAKQEPPGLKINHELMLELSGIQSALVPKEGLVLKGFDTALVPLRKGAWPEYSRWHPWRTPGVSIYLQDLVHGERDGANLPNLAAEHLEIFCGKDVYIGWSAQSNVLLGTSLDEASVELKGSGTSIAKILRDRKQDSRQFQLKLGLPFTPIGISAGVQTAYEIAPTTATAGIPARYRDSVRESTFTQVLLFDVENRNAWLVPEVALLVFAVLASLRKREYTHFSDTPSQHAPVQRLQLPAKS